MKKAKTIHKSITQGNMLIFAGGVFLTVFFTVCLVFIHICQQSCVHYSNLLAQASNAIIEANRIFRTVDNIVYEPDYSTSTDLSTPEFDALYSASSAEHASVATLSQSTKKLYDEFLTTAASVLQTNGVDKEAAQEMADAELTVNLNELIDSIHSISDSYNSMNEQASAIVTSAITFSTIIGLICLLAMLIYSLVISNKMSKTIAKPIVAVSEWADTLSTGADHIEKADMGPESEIPLVEIQRMVKAFTAMSANIKENVDVVRKVADGDMTAFVNIRSSQDTLGKSLYKMVQSNDIMFAQITQIAKSVTDGTDSISAAAKLLADSCTEQANNITDLQDEIEHTNKLTRENARDAAHASSLANTIHNEITVSKGKMQKLVEAIKDIFEASEKVFGVISDIESIANQTNLLAINANIEASRAGAAGKSFAVVASSVKELADKSAESALETKNLIEDTMNKAKHGSLLSDETYTAFESIINSLEQVIGVSEKIAESGAKQQSNMENIKNTIDDISKVVAGNAASSEQSAAMTVEISKNANTLKEAMDQFQLRNRVPGKPYIPPAKEDDQEFVRIATENYNRFMNTPEGRKLSEQMNLN